MSKAVYKKKNLIIAIVIVTGIFLVTGYFIANIVLASVFESPLNVVYALKKADISADVVDNEIDDFFANEIYSLLQIQKATDIYQFIEDEERFEKSRSFLNKTTGRLSSKQLADFTYHLNISSKDINFFDRVGLLYAKQTWELIPLYGKYKDKFVQTDVKLPQTGGGKEITFEYDQCLLFYENLYKVCEQFKKLTYKNIALITETIKSSLESKNFTEEVVYKNLIFSARSVAGLLYDVSDIKGTLDFLAEITGNSDVKTFSNTTCLIRLAIDACHDLTDNQIYGIIGHLFDYNATLVAAAKEIAPFAKVYSKDSLAKEVNIILHKFGSQYDMDGNYIVEFFYRISNYDENNLTAEQNSEIKQFFDNFSPIS